MNITIVLWLSGGRSPHLVCVSNAARGHIKMFTEYFPGGLVLIALEDRLLDSFVVVLIHRMKLDDVVDWKLG